MISFHAPNAATLGGSCRRGLTSLTVVGTSLLAGSVLVGSLILAGPLFPSGPDAPVEIAYSAMEVSSDGTIVRTDNGEEVVVKNEQVRTQVIQNIESGAEGSYVLRGDTNHAAGVLHAGEDHTHDEPSADPDGHNHDHSLHCGVAAVPGAAGGVILQELLVNERQTISRGVQPHRFLVDEVNYNVDKSNLWNGPAVFTAIAGEVPPGVSLNKDGTWSGAVTTDGTYNFMVSVTNDTTSFIVNYTLFVVDENLKGDPVWSNVATNTSQTIEQGTLPVPFQVTGPGKLRFFTFKEIPGLMLTSGGGWSLVPSVPMEPGTYNATISAGTIYGCGGVDQDFTLTVKAAAPLVFTSASTNTSQTVSTKPGSSLSALKFSGNLEDLSVNVSSGKLPKGVSLGQDGTFYGTPTIPGTYVFSVTATNRLFQEVTGRVTVTATEYVNQDVAFTSSTANTTQRISVDEKLAPVVARAVNGGALTYRVESGALPPGVTLNQDGSFSGTTSQVGYWNVIIRATHDDDRQGVTSLNVGVFAKQAPVPGPSPEVDIPVLPPVVPAPTEDEPTVTVPVLPPLDAPAKFTDADLEASRQSAEDPNAPQLGDEVSEADSGSDGSDGSGADEGSSGTSPGDADASPEAADAEGDTATEESGQEGGPDTVADSNWDGLERISAQNAEVVLNATNPEISEVSDTRSVVAIALMGAAGALMLVLLGASGWFWRARRNM